MRVTPEQAAENGWALYDTNPKGDARIIFYDPEIALADRIDVDCIIGYAYVDSQFDSSDGYDMMCTAAAINGCGPLLYDYALSRGGKVIADRTHVSAEARAIWDFYHRRRPDVKRESVPTTIQVNSTYGDDASALNYAYWIAGGVGRFLRLAKNHTRFVQDYAAGTLTKKRVETNLTRAASDFFHRMITE